MPMKWFGKRASQSATWEGMIGCEGGPIIVANAEDFEHWRGSDPLPAEARRELHVWSAFTVELPERFRPPGPAGHQLIPGEDHDELVAMRRELVGFVQGRWPGSTVREEFETCTVTRPDGARLWVQLAPVSEYDRCIRDLDCITAHRFDFGWVTFDAMPTSRRRRATTVASASRLKISSLYHLRARRVPTGRPCQGFSSVTARTSPAAPFPRNLSTLKKPIDELADGWWGDSCSGGQYGHAALHRKGLGDPELHLANEVLDAAAY